MTYYEAALQVLKSAKRPLTTHEITDQALKNGLITPQGKTPLATMSAMLYTRLHRDSIIVKLENRTDTRARRGSVRWTLRDATAGRATDQPLAQ
jgi:HB1, ASXL, restriction endonuclease HTH domain